MKKLLKSKIYGSINSKICAEKMEKVKLCNYCSRTVTKFGLKRVKKKEAETQTLVSVLAQSKRNLNIRWLLWAQKAHPHLLLLPRLDLNTMSFLASGVGTPVKISQTIYMLL